MAYAPAVVIARGLASDVARGLHLGSRVAIRGSHAAASLASIPVSKAQPLTILHEPTSAEFSALGRTPAILTGCLSHWDPSVWDPDQLCAEHPELTVSVELSRNGGDYRDSFAWRPGRSFARDVEMPLSTFIRRFYLTAQPQEPDLGSCRDAGQQGNSPSPVTGYLAQHALLDRAPRLSAACPAPPFLPPAAAAAAQRRVWMGPGGTTTPLHRDPYDNFLCQVVGHKRVRLYAHEQEGFLERFHHPLVLRNTSKVDVQASDIAERHPGFASQPYWEGRIGPGEVLYLPKRVWHHVVAESRSISVSFWW